MYFLKDLATLLIISNHSLLIILTSCDSFGNSTLLDDYEPAGEIQHTYCKVSTEQLQATANTTISRELKGVCTLNELKKAVAVILREIQMLKDALIIKTASTRSSNQRKFPMDEDRTGLFSYYWSIKNASFYLHDGKNVLSPAIDYQGGMYQLRLTIVDSIASIRLEVIDAQVQPVKHTYTIFVLSAFNASRDQRLDVYNSYTLTLHRLQQFRRDTNQILIKLVLY